MLGKEIVALINEKTLQLKVSFSFAFLWDRRYEWKETEENQHSLCIKTRRKANNSNDEDEDDHHHRKMIRKLQVNCAKVSEMKSLLRRNLASEENPWISLQSPLRQFRRSFFPNFFFVLFWKNKVNIQKLIANFLLIVYLHDNHF